MLTAQPAMSAGSPTEASWSSIGLSRPAFGGSGRGSVGGNALAGLDVSSGASSVLAARDGCSANTAGCAAKTGSGSASGVQSCPHRAQRTVWPGASRVLGTSKVAEHDGQTIRIGL